MSLCISRRRNERSTSVITRSLPVVPGDQEKKRKKLKKVLPDSTQEATRCCAGKICKRGMHSTCWEERGGSPLPLDPHGKSVFWSCADLDAQIRPWKSYCKSL